jgi:ribonuclease HI
MTNDKGQMTNDVWTIEIDGASRGNPGPAAFAFVIRRSGHPAHEEAECLPRTTNNAAEYTALIRALERAAEMGASSLDVRSDSELLVKQMNGEYRVKQPELKVLHNEATGLVDRFEEVRIRHVRREENRRADQLCNQALDGKEGKGALRGRQGPSQANSSREESVRQRALECLQAAAREWSRGDAQLPPPAQVLDQIWSIFDEEGLLKSRRSS